MTIETDITQGAVTVGTILPFLETAASALFPDQTAIIKTIVSIGQDVVNGVPEAVALYDTITSGQPVTQTQLDAYAVAENSSYAKLMADIAAAEKTAV